MPFFSHPANADWLLAVVKIPLGLISLIFSFIHLIGPFGQIALVALIIGLFARNIMAPARV